MTKQDRLFTGVYIAMKRCAGSAKTQYNHLREAIRFVLTLRMLGYGVKEWKNINNKHVQAVVNYWNAEGKSAATIKEYLTGVRFCSNFWNDNPNRPKINPSNKYFGIENRVYISNLDKSLSDKIYKEAISTLKNSSDPHHNRIAAQIGLSRELGLRKEEAYKFTSKSVKKNGNVHISHGTKGGRERMLLEISKEGREAIDYAKSISGSNNLIPKGFSERQWEGKVYRVLRKIGFRKDINGASIHGLRHAYAQSRYKHITGFDCVVRCGSKSEFLRIVEEIKDWKKYDQDARQTLKAELGHGADRNDIISQYIGSHL